VNFEIVRTSVSMGQGAMDSSIVDCTTEKRNRYLWDSLRRAR
jgi:hypothetical protein